MRLLLMLREITGWLLLAGGMLVFGLSLLLLLDQRVFEAVPAAGVGFIIFRGGIHLLKSALALRVVLQTSVPPAAARRSSLPGTSLAAISPPPVAILPRQDAARRQAVG
ncbi:MAG: hypothetical protein WHU94_03020 [Thermogemmata sp.]|jgi:hypothetical protein|uniref:Uncharacterized protein n=1 Tax=Thermogemmata fonticola TaxID=2755323 RepID=A0A7V8VG73_9BACT|nr:hypothetical protein [Thermogemmata fonticola]MBA2227464.1 hypothetical protein [Thermogemmata fonticola]MCX8140463.1 hypothetical protein [Gemmataceae bacterium]